MGRPAVLLSVLCCLALTPSFGFGEDTPPATQATPATAAGPNGSAPAAKTIFSLSAVGGQYKLGSPAGDSFVTSYGAKATVERRAESSEESLCVEVSFSYFEEMLNKGYLYRLDAVYPFLQKKTFIPYFAFGAGAVTVKRPSDATTLPLLNYGATLKYFYEEYLALRLDGRHLIVLDHSRNSTRSDFELLAGINYFFGIPRKKPFQSIIRRQEAPRVEEELRPGLPITIDYGLFRGLGSEDIFLNDLAQPAPPIQQPQALPEVEAAPLPEEPPASDLAPEPQEPPGAGMEQPGSEEDQPTEPAPAKTPAQIQTTPSPAPDAGKQPVK